MRGNIINYCHVISKYSQFYFWYQTRKLFFIRKLYKLQHFACKSKNLEYTKFAKGIAPSLNGYFVYNIIFSIEYASTLQLYDIPRFLRRRSFRPESELEAFETCVCLPINSKWMNLETHCRFDKNLRGRSHRTARETLGERRIIIEHHDAISVASVAHCARRSMLLSTDRAREPCAFQSGFTIPRTKKDEE